MKKNIFCRSKKNQNLGTKVKSNQIFKFYIIILNSMRFFVSCPFGLSKLVQNELKYLGLTPHHSFET